MTRAVASIYALVFVAVCRALLGLPGTVEAWRGGTPLLHVQLVVSLVAPLESVLLSALIVAFALVGIGMLTGNRSLHAVWPFAFCLLALDLVGLPGADLAGALVSRGAVGVGVVGVDTLSALLNWAFVLVPAWVVVWLIWLLMERAGGSAVGEAG